MGENAGHENIPCHSGQWKPANWPENYTSEVLAFPGRKTQKCPAIRGMITTYNKAVIPWQFQTLSLDVYRLLRYSCWNPGGRILEKKKLFKILSTMRNHEHISRGTLTVGLSHG